MAYDLTITSFSDDLNQTINAPTGAAFETVPSSRYGGRMRTVTGNFELATTDIDDNDIIVLARIPANSTVHKIEFSNDALDAGSALVYNVGIYQPDGTVVDEDAYASLVTSFQAAVAPASATEIRYEAATDAADMGDRVWESGGESDPGGVMRDIAITISTVAATAAAGTLAFIIQYTID